MRHTRDCDHVVSQGTLRDRASRVDYYTTVPTPSQWIAVGVLVSLETEDPVRRPRRMLVGTGSCEEAAIADLERRFTYFIEGRKPLERTRHSRIDGKIQDYREAPRRSTVEEVISEPNATADSEASRV